MNNLSPEAHKSFQQRDGHEVLQVVPVAGKLLVRQSDELEHQVARKHVRVSGAFTLQALRQTSLDDW
jgi:hypothetical protein